MARISKEELESLKTGVSLEKLVKSFGVKLRKKGKDLVGLCPFHNDTAPSFVVTPEKGLWNCLGACQTGGSVIDFVMKSQGVSYKHALEILRSKPEALAKPETRAKQPTVKRLDLLADPNTDGQSLLNICVDHYHKTLLKSPEALKYLRSRGLENEELIKRFKLGYANRTLTYRVPDKNRQAGAKLRGSLGKIGILKRSGHEHFRGSLVVPVFDEEGKVTEIYGRKIRNDLRKGTPTHLYLPGPHKGIWNLEGLKGQREVILCEALIDAMTFWVNGFCNVTASYGIEGFGKDHEATFKALGIQKILIAYDADQAGNNAAEKLARRLEQSDFDCYRVQVPKDLDINDYALNFKPASESLGRVLRQAKFVGERGPKQVLENKAPSLKKEPPSKPALSPSLPTKVKAPTAPKINVEAEVKEREIVMRQGDRRYRIRGLDKNLSPSQLKVNILVSLGDGFHVDTLDLYSSRQRIVFVKEAAKELQRSVDVLKKDLGRVLLKLEEIQDELIAETLKTKEKEIEISEEDRKAALDLLKDPELIKRLLRDFEACGVVGEESNKIVGYLSALSRKLSAPLGVLIQSSSAAGKSSLMEAILSFMPEEETVKFSAMTGQSLFYMGGSDLKHKILAIAEEEGASKASYALKVLQSERELSIASTGKNPVTGRLETMNYKVEGPIMLFFTTTAIELDEELLNRCIVLSVDEGQAQTQAIHRLQRRKRTMEGWIEQDNRDTLLKLHRNAQRLLKPLKVLNPYSNQLTFLSDRTRTRRDHEKYLTLIDVIALLHQFQRPVKNKEDGAELKEYVEVSLADIELANKVADDVFGHSLDDMPPQTRRLLLLIYEMVKRDCQEEELEQSDYRFTRRQVREYSKWGNTQLKVHLTRLEELEYLIFTGGGGRGNLKKYQLLYDGRGQDGERFLPGLLNVNKLKDCDYDKKKSGGKSRKSGQSRGEVGG